MSDLTGNPKQILLRQGSFHRCHTTEISLSNFSLKTVHRKTLLINKDRFTIKYVIMGFSAML